MLDRLFRKLGYVPATSIPFVTESAASMAEPLPAHRRDEASFDVTLARHDDLCFYYDDGADTHSYAVGCNDWAPIAIAGLMLAQSERCSQIALEAVISRLWINRGAAELDSWHNANTGVFGTVRERVGKPGESAGALAGRELNLGTRRLRPWPRWRLPRFLQRAGYVPGSNRRRCFWLVPKPTRRFSCIMQ
jgi:hypothetical protein